MAETAYPEVYDHDVERVIDHGPIQTLWYSDGSVGSTDPVTVTPSIACGDCGLFATAEIIHASFITRS